MRPIKIFIIIAILTTGCNKNVDIQKGLQFDHLINSVLSDSDTVRNCVIVRAIQEINRTVAGPDSPYIVNTWARFTNTSNVEQNAGTLTINGKSAVMDSYGNYAINYRDSSVNVNNQSAQLMGTNVSISVSGSSQVEPFSSQVYVPKKIFSNPVMPTTYSGGSFPLRWTPDTTTYSQVVILVRLMRNAGTDELSDYKQFITNDDGSFDIIDKTFLSFPSGSRFVISIGRLSEKKIITPSGRATYLFGISEAHSSLIYKL